MRRWLLLSVIAMLMLGVLPSGSLAQETAIQQTDAAEAAFWVTLPAGIRLGMRESEVIDACAQMGYKYDNGASPRISLISSGIFDEEVWDAEVWLHYAYPDGLKQVSYLIYGYSGEENSVGEDEEDEERSFHADQEYIEFVKALRDAHGAQELAFDEVNEGELCVSFGEEISWSVRNAGEMQVTFFQENPLQEREIEEMIQEGVILGDLKLGMPIQEAWEEIEQMPGWYNEKSSLGTEHTYISLAGQQVSIYVLEDAGTVSDIRVRFSIWDEAANYSFFNTILDIMRRKCGPPLQWDHWAGWTSCWFAQGGLYVKVEHDFMVGDAAISIFDKME